MKRSLPFIIILVLPIILGVSYYLYINSGEQISEAIKQATVKPETTPEPTKAITDVVNPVIHASFAINTHGTTRTFTDPMYHNQSEEAYITAEDPAIITIKKPGITWQAFFDTLPFEVTPICLTTGLNEVYCTNAENKLSFYLNGAEDPNALDKEINDQDTLLINYGNPNKTQEESQPESLTFPGL